MPKTTRRLNRGKKKKSSDLQRNNGEKEQTKE